MEEHVRKVLFVKGGQGGGTTPRVSIPMEYIKALEITKEAPEVKITLEGKKIVIEKAEEKKMIVNRDQLKEMSEGLYKLAKDFDGDVHGIEIGYTEEYVIRVWLHTHKFFELFDSYKLTQREATIHKFKASAGLDGVEYYCLMDRSECREFIEDFEERIKARQKRKEEQK